METASVWYAVLTETVKALFTNRPQEVEDAPEPDTIEEQDDEDRGEACQD